MSYYYYKCPVTLKGRILHKDDNVLVGNNQIRVTVGLDPIAGAGPYWVDGVGYRDPIHSEEEKDG